MRRRRNKIEALQRKDGSWAEDNKELKNIDVRYYRDLLSSVREGEDNFIIGHFPTMYPGTVEESRKRSQWRRQRELL